MQRIFKKLIKNHILYVYFETNKNICFCNGVHSIIFFGGGEVNFNEQKKTHYFVNLIHGKKVYKVLQFNRFSSMIDKNYILIAHYNFHNVVNIVISNLIHFFWL